MTETLDIRKIPVSELQTRDGREVLGVFECHLHRPGTVLVIVRQASGLADSILAQYSGKFITGDLTSNNDIIRKKQLKGRVLYREYGRGGRLAVTDKEYTEAEFKDSYTSDGIQIRGFVRILTEVPELPTEEV